MLKIKKTETIIFIYLGLLLFFVTPSIIMEPTFIDVIYFIAVLCCFIKFLIIRSK